MKKSILISSLLLAGSALIAVPSAFAGGCAPGEACYEQYKTKPRKKMAPMADKVMAPKADKKMAPVAAAPAAMSDSDLRVGLSFGGNVLFHDCQDTSFAPGVYADFRKGDVPINVRIGAEIAHLNASDFEFQQDSAFVGQQPDFTYVRIPLSVEYVQPISEGTEFLIGGGPDLIHTSGNGSDGNVGFHLGARVVKDITDNLNASFGAGYLWADTDPAGEDLDLNSAFTGASIGYKF